MSTEQPNNLLHGVTLKAMLEDLVERRGWIELSELIRIRCFERDPSLQSSLKFLRKTDWARTRVEELYLRDQLSVARNRKRNQRRAAQRAHRKAQEAGDDETPES